MKEDITKVLFLNHVSEIGGAETGLLNMVGKLDRGRFEPLVVIPAPGRLAERLNEQDAQVVHLPLERFTRTSNPFVLLRYVSNVRRVVRELALLCARENVKIIHANSNNAQIYGGRAAALTNALSIWHCRDLVKLGLLGKWLGSHAAGAIAVSEAVREHLFSYVKDTGKVVKIPNGVDLDQFIVPNVVPARRSLGFGEDDFVIGMMGQLVPWKKHSVFLQAAEVVAASMPTARFVIVGSDLFGDHPDYVKALKDDASRGRLKGRVTFTGYRQDIVSILAAMNVVVHPAAREPFGRAVVEAMALGKPVVAVDACGPAEIIAHGSTGILVPPNDGMAVAMAVERLARDKALADKIGKAARAQVECSFDARDVVKKVEQQYMILLDRMARTVSP